MIEELCEQLKKKRKELGYTIEETVDKTKLHPSVIHDIEEGNLHSINPTYLKGFIRIYAAFLGVDTKDVLEEIVEAKETVIPPAYREERSGKQTAPAFPLNLRRYITVGLVGLAVIVMLVMGIKFVIRSVFRRQPRSASSTPSSLPIHVKEVIPQEISKKINVSLTAKRNCFLRVRADGKLLFEGVLHRRAVESWSADREIEFKISDGSAVYIEVNGKPLPPLTPSRKPIKSLKITPSEISVTK